MVKKFLAGFVLLIILVQIFSPLCMAIEIGSEDTTIQEQTGTITIDKDGELVENRKLLFTKLYSNFKTKGTKL